jgi:hypothetical protein
MAVAREDEAVATDYLEVSKLLGAEESWAQENENENPRLAS